MRTREINNGHLAMSFGGRRLGGSAMHRTVTTFLLLLGIGAAVTPEALSMGPSTPVIPYEVMKFEGKNATTPTVRIDAEIRFIFGRGWSLPALPGTRKAIDRERHPLVSDSTRRLTASLKMKPAAPPERREPENPWGLPAVVEPAAPARITGHLDSGRFALICRGGIDLSHRSIDTYDQVSDLARINSTEFSGEGVRGSFAFTRKQGGLSLGLSSRFLGLAATFDFFSLELGVSGDLVGMGLMGSGRTRLGGSHSGSGTGFTVECSPFPFSPTVTVYYKFSRWDAEDWTGEDREIGVKVRFAGFSVFGGHRQEKYERNVGSDESRLEVRIRGIVVGLGVSF
jgi:hypothetical protein